MMEVKCVYCRKTLQIEGPVPEDQEIGCSACEMAMDFLADGVLEAVPPGATVH